MNQKQIEITFKDDEKEAILNTIAKIKHKKYTNIYFFFDNRTKQWHLFHHTEQDEQCQANFEEAIFVILKTLEIKSYCIVSLKDNKIKVDRIFTNTGIYISNLLHNLES